MFALTRFQKWLSPPVFPDDEDKSRRASLLNVLLLSIPLFLLTGILSNLIGGREFALIYLFHIVGIVIALQLRFVVQRGYVIFASRVVIIGVLIIAMILGITLGTLRTPNTSLFILAFVAAGVLLNRRAAVLTTISSSVYVVLLD